MEEKEIDFLPELVLIGGSAGSIRLMCEFLPLLSTNLSVPIVIVVHRGKEKSSVLRSIFQNYSQQEVVEPENKLLPQPNTIYLAPSDSHLIVNEEGYLMPIHSEMVQYSRPSIDVLMSSAAKVYRSKITSVLVTGANMDGVVGLVDVKKNGGRVIVQNPEEALIDYMPKSALVALTPDYIFTIQELANYINQTFQLQVTEQG